MADKYNLIEKNKFYFNIDWPLLFFIIGLVYVKTYIKVISIICYFIYLIYKKVEFPKRVVGASRFYLLILLTGTVSSLISGSFSTNYYWIGYLFGLLQWLVAAVAFYLLYVAVKNVPANKLKNTVEAFFVANIIVCFLQLVKIMIEARSFMPYWIYDSAEKFGASTGDNLFGIFGNNSITNAAICILGGIYFLFRNRYWLSFFCFLIMLLCTSNLSLLFTVVSLLFIIVFTKAKKIRLAGLSFVAGLLIIYPLLSPGNLAYIKTVYRTFVLHDATNYENPNKLKVLGSIPVAPKPADSSGSQEVPAPVVIKMAYKLPISNNGTGYVEQLKALKYLSDKYNRPNSTVVLDQEQLKRSFFFLYGVPVNQTPLTIYSKPGKVYSMKQTGYFLISDIKNFLFGAGIGNFSSKLAIRMTGLRLQGQYPEKYVYASPYFVEYHLYEFFYYLCQNVALHSILNLPYSVYNQIAGEYGLIGVAAFIIFYLGYFWKNRNKSGYGKYLLIILLLFFGVDYWFEMASFTVIFELLMLMDILIDKDNDADKSTTGNGVNAGI
jgi:hypothetical protein